MMLRGSCHCGKVRFQVRSETPYPYMFCYCSICRKTTGGAYGCNVMGRRETLRLTGKKHLRSIHAWIRTRGRRPVRSPGERWFCSLCGTHLYVLDDRWPEGVWPNAGAVDTRLPVPPARVHILTRDKPDWVPLAGRGPRYEEYPPLSIAAWHEKHGLGPKRPRRRRRV